MHGSHVFNDSISDKDIVIGGKGVTFQESLFACKGKLSKTSRLLRRAATGNCPDRLGCHYLILVLLLILPLVCKQRDIRRSIAQNQLFVKKNQSCFRHPSSTSSIQ